MSISEKQAQRAAAVNLDDDPGIAPGTPAEPRAPRTAPGQLMDLQGRYRTALARIEELEKGGVPRELELSRIIRVPGRQRPLSPEERSELKTNLSKNKLIHPVTVLPETPEGFELVSGYNRVDIYEELERPTILAVVLDVTPEQAGVLAFYANLLAPSLPDYSKYEGLKMRQAETGYTLEELSAESGMSRSSISRLLQYEHLPPAAQSLLKEHPFVLGATAAAALAQATKAGRGDLVVGAVQKLVDASKPEATSSLDPGAARFTEEKAVAYANGAKPAAVKPTPSAPLVIRQGKKNFAKLVVRGDQVTIKFSDPSVSPEEWAAKFETFMKDEIAKKAG